MNLPFHIPFNFTTISVIDTFNLVVCILFFVCYSYQIFYVIVSLTKSVPSLDAKKNHKYAVLISARNEQAVIADLISSIKNQNYPQELIDIYVIADNCSDKTALIARNAGATVFVRYDKNNIGKGFALDYGIHQIWEQFPNKKYEAYFVFDADNVLDKNYFTEMNKTFDNGAKASTSYRNSKNFDSNWISSGYGVWFLREAKFLSQSRLTLNTSCAISGTGFFISADIIKQAGGWKWHLLTEDIEFSAKAIIDEINISYSPKAILYDEQPTTFKDSWHQRTRWAKGFYQVFGKYAPELIKGIFKNKKGHKFACFDMLMTIAPGMLLTIFTMFLNLIILMLCLSGTVSTGTAISSSISSIIFCLCNYLFIMFAFGVTTVTVEWESIRASSKRKILSVFTFPLFMLTYIPIALIALIKKVEWTPITHNISVDVNDYATTEKSTFSQTPEKTMFSKLTRLDLSRKKTL